MKKILASLLVALAVVLSTPVSAEIRTEANVAADGTVTIVKQCYAPGGYKVPTYEQDLEKLSQQNIIEAERYGAVETLAITKHFSKQLSWVFQDNVSFGVIWAQKRVTGLEGLAFVVYDTDGCYLDHINGNWNAWDIHKNIIFQEAAGENL